MLASRLLDRLAAARHDLERRNRDGRHPVAAALTLLAATLVLGGLLRLATDDTAVQLALPEPVPPAEIAPSPARLPVGEAALARLHPLP